MFTARPPSSWKGTFVDLIDGDTPPGEHRIRVKWAPDVPLIDPLTYPGTAPFTFAAWPPHDNEYQPHIRASEHHLEALHRWEAANFPRPTREPFLVAYAAPGDDFGPNAEVTADAWIDLVSADGRALRACLDISDATEDGIVTVAVHQAAQPHGSTEPQPDAS